MATQLIEQIFSLVNPLKAEFEQVCSEPLSISGVNLSSQCRFSPTTITWLKSPSVTRLAPEAL
jgi:hypothetical protein